MTRNHREFTRVPPKLEAVVVTDDYQAHACETRNISLHGVYVITNDVLSKETPCEITLYLSGSFDEIQLTLRGNVVRSDTGGMAIEFKEVDIDSFEHLKKIILLNADTPNTVTSEFKEHLGIKKN